MKKQILVAALAVSMAACSGSKQETETKTVAENNLEYFGDTITAEGSLPAEKVEDQLQGKDSVRVKLTGTIDEVCQKKGCWMNIKIGGDKTMMVRFKDYGFFVPKDAAGKTVTFEGVAFTDTTSVAELKHYAEDAGKAKEEIEKITQPEVNIGFEANGLIIKK